MAKRTPSNRSTKKAENSRAMTRTGDWKPVFFEHLSQMGIVNRAAKAAGISADTAYEHKRKGGEFAAQWKSALRASRQVLEAEAWRRAVEGVSKPVYQSGKKVGGVQEYSDTLLIFLLKGNNPKKFRDTARIEHTGKNGAPIESKTTVVTDLEQCARRFDEYTRRQLGTGPVPGDRN